MPAKRSPRSAAPPKTVKPILEQRLSSRRQADAELALALDKLQGLLSAMTDVVMVLDGTGRYLEIIPTNPNLLYRPREELLQHTLHETLPIEKAAELHNLITRALETGDTVHTEYTLQIEDNFVWFDAAISPLTAESVMWVARDVTARKQAEDLTREQVLQMDIVLRSSLSLTANIELPLLLNNVLQSALRLAPDATDAYLFLYDAEGDQLRFGGAAPLGADQALAPRPNGLTYTVARRGEIIVVPNMSLHPLFAELPDTLRNAIVGLPLKIEQKVLGVMNVSYAKAHDFSSSELRALRLLGDQAAVALHNAQLYRQLQQNADELATLYQASSALLNVGSDLRVLAHRVAKIVTEKFKFAHCGVLQLVEAARELRLLAQAGTLWDEQGAQPPLALEGPGLIAAAARAGEMIYAPNVNHEPRYLVGHPHTQSELVVPLKIGSRVLGVLNVESVEPAAFDDRLRHLIGAFAEQVALAMENASLLSRLELAREIAEEANSIKSQFLANTSHELRTPLTGIIGSLSMVMDSLCESREEEHECVQIAYTASQRLLTMINNVLDVAKIEAGHMDIHLQAMEAELVMTDVYTLMRLPADEKRIALEIDLPEVPLPRVWADPDMVRQVLLNLVGNAVKFTHKGKVRLAASVHDRKLIISVTDTGIGIAPADQSRLFQPFVQVDGSLTRRYGGTGLGLSISRRLAELMGGEMTLFSAGLGNGATLSLTLLLAPNPLSPTA